MDWICVCTHSAGGSHIDHGPCEAAGCPCPAFVAAYGITDGGDLIEYVAVDALDVPLGVDA